MTSEHETQRVDTHDVTRALKEISNNISKSKREKCCGELSAIKIT